MSSPSGVISFTEGEQKLLLSIFRNLDGNINAKWDIVAAECGYKDASIARMRWSQIKSKKNLGSSGADSPKKSLPNPPDSKQSTKRAIEDDSLKGGHNDQEDAGLGAEGSVAGKPKRKRAKKKAKVTEPVAPEDEADAF